MSRINIRQVLDSTIAVLLLTLIVYASVTFRQHGQIAKANAAATPVQVQSRTADATTPGEVTMGDFQAAIANSEASVVKVESAYGCGNIESLGTGFVIAPGLVATNAHVVAGYTTIYVHDANGEHLSTPILFDTKMDFALLRVTGLAGTPLPLNTDGSNMDVLGASNGSRDIFMGYPGGNDFAIGMATINNELQAETNDIYGNDEQSTILQLNATIVHGDSGSPLVQRNGQVVGIVYGMAPDGSATGYAIPTNAFYPELEQAKNVTSPVDTGICITD